jgi:hypothetical protein
MLTLVAYRFMVGGLVLNASRLTRLMEIEHAPGVEQPGHIRPDTVGEPISILRPTCLHAMFQAPLGSKKP